MIQSLNCSRDRLGGLELVPVGGLIQAELLVDPRREYPHHLVDIDLPDAEFLVLEVEEQRGTLVLVLQQILESLLEVGLAGLVLFFLLTQVVDLDNFIVLRAGLGLAMLSLTVLAMRGVLKNLIGEKLLVVQDMFEMFLGVVIKLY